MIYTVDRGKKTRTIVLWWNEDTKEGVGKAKKKAFIGLYVKRDTKEKDGLAVIELETM